MNLFSNEPLKEYISSSTPKKKRKTIESYFFTVLLGLFITGLLFGGTKYIGMVISGTNADTVKIERAFDTSDSLMLNLSGNVTSIRISGLIIGNGTARIYANKILVLESTTIEKKGANLITGMVVGDFADPGNNETDDEAQPDIQSESPTEEVTAADAKTPEVGVQQSQDGDENNTRMNNITSDQLLILDEVNIIETYEENISAEINLTQPTQENNLTNRTEIRLENASMIILPENQSATNGTNFNLTDDFDEEILINETSAENISVTDTLENISFENNATVNLTIIIENITSNESVIANQTNVTLIINQSVSTNATENITQSENITADMIPEEIIRFENHCEDSCVLNLPGRDIILSIELDGDARLNLTSLTYTYIEAVPENLSVEPQNLSINQSLIDSAIIKSEYSDVEINKPVKWTRMINASIVNITTLPKDSFNISSDAGFKVRVKEDEYDAQKFNEIALSRSIDRELARLPKIIEEKDVGKTFEKITSLSARLSKLDTPNIEIDSSLAVEFSEKDIVELDYYVDGPTTEEVQINSQTKRITVSSDVHYENVIAYTDIPEAKKESIQLYWLKDIGKELFNDVEYIDTNKNGLIDKLQWIIPHLSNQTFEISIIVLNPYTYLRDGETWVVAFNATGIGNLTISSPNAGWTEFLKDDIETFDEMRFLNLSCGGTELLSSLKLVGVDNNTYDYTDLLSNNTIDIKKLFLPDYECNDTGYLSNYMIEAGYATLLFEFSNQNATVTDYAYDPVASYSIADDADDGHEYPQNTWQSTGSWFGHYSTSDEWMVTRFRNIKIPQGATITRALLNVTADSGEGGSYSVYVKVRAQNADSGGLPGASNLPSTWTLTGNGTDFDIDYPSEWSSGQKHSIDITNVIQEIVNRPGWSINNNISIVFENDGSTGDHDIEIFDYPTNAATLDIEISNTIPTHETPYITPTYPNITSNLTCNWNSVQDADGDAVVNITNWYINNVSTTVLYMPFEGNGNEDYIATDYSGHGNNGNVSKDYLSDWQEAASSCYGSLTKDETYNANTMTIGGITFDKGLGCHAQTGTWASYVNYNLSGGASRFIATIGIDDECDGSATSSNATFRVLGDGSVLYTSGWLGRDSAPLNLNISIAGINNLSLQIDEADGSNNCDHSEWANAYVISSSKWNRTGGKVGGGYYFEKNDYIAVAHDESLNLSNDLTIEFWVKPKQASLSGFVVSKMDTGNDDGYSIMLWGGKINAMLNGDWDKVADTALNGNQWYHVAWTKAGTASKIYLNGNLDGTWADAPNTVLPNTEALDIGRHPTGYYFNGSIDEVKIYNISLSQEQIIADYQAGLAGRSNNLVVQEELSENEAWICSVTPNDGYSDGITKNSSSVFIIPNSLPTQSEPFITPTYPNMTSNLACNWNNTFDMEGDAVQNITTWFKNNASTAIVYLPFEGGSSSSFTKDYSGLGNSGAVTGATWSSSGGKVGGAYSFDGNDYIDLGELNSSTSSNKLSVEAWVYVTNFSGSSNTGSIVSKYSWDGSYTRSWDFNVGNETTQNESCFTVFHVGDWSYVSGVCTDHLATNTWLYLVGTFDGNSINIYVNGILNDSNTVDGTEIHDTGYSVRIGSTPDDAYFFKGYIDEVKIYNYSLSAQQILANYMAGSSGKNANLIVRQETAENDNWYCSVTPNDGYNDGITKNSTAAIIFTSNPPTQDTPYITPSPSGFNSNLTCNWNNSVDIDNDPFTNITVWYKNNIPTARLYLPFEGNDMDEDISTNDYSGYGSIGYVDDGNASSPDGSTGPIWSRTGGKVGGAYTFDGYDDSIILASSPQFDITGNQLTLMAWVKYQGTESGMIFSHSGWWNGYRFGVEPDGNYAWLQINGSAGYSLDSATNSIQPNSWYHIAAVYNGSKMMFYINGVKDSNELAKSNNLDSAPDDDVNIGMAGDCTGASWCEPFNGSIDEVRIFNYSLSAAQIKRIYEEESQGKNTQVLVADETTLGEQWFCSVTPNDGFMDGTTKNSSVATIINVPPAQNAPYITPYVPNITSNLTCNWNNVNDADYESVVNITNWYKNNKSTTLLYMPFEGGSISGTPGSNGAAKDYSGFENNGTVINATWNRTGGIVGGSYEFNGQNTYITLPAISLGGNSGTIEGWIKFRATSSASSQYIIGRDYGSVALGVTNDGGFRALFMQNWNWCANYTRALNPGSWYYIVGTIDGTNQYIYVNGTLDTTCPNTASWSSENSQWAISSNDGTWSEDQFVNGTIDEVKLYNSSLTAQQIRANYQAGLANRPSNIIVSDETSTYDQWLCSVTPNDGTQDGTTLNSSAVTIFPYGLVNITAIECQINSSVWRSCSSALWNDTITQVKVNCSGTNGIKYATYNLTNVPDAATHFNASNATSSSANSWTYDNPDIKISDSGEFTMTVSCYDGVFLQINSTSWAVPWGNISSVWITPTSSLNMSQNQTGTFTSYMQCTGGECGNVTVTIDPTTELIGDPSYYTIKVNNSYSIKLADSVQYAGSEWYDLETDPGQSSDNIPSYGLFSWWTSFPGGWADLSYSTVYSARILENSSARIVIERKHYNVSQYNSTDRLTFYPTGQLYFYENITSLYSNIDYFELPFAYLSSPFNSNWTIDNSLEYILRQQSGVANSPTYLIIADRTYSGTIQGDGVTDREWWTNSADYNLASGQSAKRTIAYALKPNAMTQSEAIARRNDYRNPATTTNGNLTIITGSKVTTDELDYNTDGYAEGEGAYVFMVNRTAASNNSLIFNITGATYTRYSPVFKITNYSANSLPMVTFKNASGTFILVSGVDYNIAFQNRSNATDTVIVQYLRNIGSNVQFNISSFIAPKGAISTLPGAVPFWTSTSNPQVCMNMKPGYSCTTTWSVNATGVPGDYYTFYVIYNASNYSGYVRGNETSRFIVTIDGGSSPSVSAISLVPSIANTSSDLGCYATILSRYNSSLTVEYWWYNNSVLKVSGNATAIPNNTNSLISTLGRGNTTRSELWNCTIRAHDDFFYTGYNSTSLNITNEVPTQNSPTISPTSPNITSNLTCNWNNVQDLDGDAVVNITNWYKNNVSTTVLYMPFEGVNGNEA
ncbi:MAG: LamG-like jellyroll fold domain-containing protein, partial [archaeon]